MCGITAESINHSIVDDVSCVLQGCLPALHVAFLNPSLTSVYKREQVSLEMSSVHLIICAGYQDHQALFSTVYYAVQYFTGSCSSGFGPLLS